MNGRLRRQVPYVAAMAIVGYLYFKISQSAIETGEAVGPATWPRAILVFTALACLLGIVRGLLWQQAPPGAEGGGPVALRGEDAALTAPLLWGALATAAFVALVGTLGFFLATVLYLAAFMWIGGYRRKARLAAISLGGGLVFMFVFMKVVYVSLPLGVGPFAALSYLLMSTLGVR